MSKRKFRCPLYDLLGAGDTITGTALATAYATRLKTRLKDPFIADTVALILDIRTEINNRTSKYGDVDTLTLAQQNLVKAVARQMSRARETAKRAFKTNKIKLRDEFC